MKIELIVTDGHTVGYNLVPENRDEQYALQTEIPGNDRRKYQQLKR